MPVHHRKRIALLAPLYIIASIVLFMPIGHGAASTFSPFDGFIHEGLFLVLGLATFFIYSQHIRTASWVLILFAVYSEIIQSFIPSRTTDLQDMFNDCIGIALALLMFSLIKEVIPKK